MILIQLTLFKAITIILLWIIVGYITCIKVKIIEKDDSNIGICFLVLIAPMLLLFYFIREIFTKNN